MELQGRLQRDGFQPPKSVFVSTFLWGGKCVLFISSAERFVQENRGVGEGQRGIGWEGASRGFKGGFQKGSGFLRASRP